jgi:hypothetical protein
MPNQAQRKKLFRDSTVEDRLTLFQTLLETSNELTVHLALALLKVIHQELSTDQIRDRMAYKRYAEGIESLRFRMPGILHQVVSVWKSQRNNNSSTPDEWFPSSR